MIVWSAMNSVMWYLLRLELDLSCENAITYRNSGAHVAFEAIKPLPPGWLAKAFRLSYQAVGLMFWFNRKRLVGSYWFLSAANRS